jgi:hypothetical protein
MEKMPEETQITQEQLTELLLWMAQHADSLNDVASNAITLSAEVVAAMPVQTPEQWERKLDATYRLLALKEGFDKLAESARKVERGFNRIGEEEHARV